jgi:hypothetical protein
MIRGGRFGLLSIGIAVAAGLLPGVSQAQPAPTCAQGTVIYFGNGITATSDDADQVARDELPVLAAEAGLTGPMQFASAYNQTNGVFLDLLEVLEQKAAEDSRFTWFVMNNIVGHIVRGQQVPPSFLVGLPGVIGFVAQVQDLVDRALVAASGQSTAFYDADVGLHARSYAANLRAGSRVIVVAHSQGNLYANAARRQLNTLAPGALGSFGVAAVATPADTAVDGHVTSKSDQVIALLLELGRTVVAPNFDIPPSPEDPRGHAFVGTYINPALSGRKRVVTLLAALGTRVAYPLQTCSSAPPGSGATLANLSVEFGTYCCSDATDDTTLLGSRRFSTVGQAVEFPDIAGSRDGIYTVPADVDVRSSAVEIVYNTNAATLSTPGFNGYVLRFSGAQVPKIARAEFGPGSTVDLTTARTFVNGNSLFINVPGISVKVGSRISVLLTLE